MDNIPSNYQEGFKKIGELIEKLAKEWNKIDQPEYLIKVLPSKNGYLNYDMDELQYFTQTLLNGGDFKTHFTLSEIADLKANPELKAINFDKCEYIRVENEED